MKPKDGRGKRKSEDPILGDGYLSRIIEEYGDNFVTGKIEPEKPVCQDAVDPVQGCGDPHCRICLPTSGRSSSFLFGGEDIARRATVESMRAITDLILFGDKRIPYGFAMDPSKSDPQQQERDRLQQAERTAREPIKQYLLESKTEMNWSDVVGNEEAHRAMIEAIEFPIKHKQLFEFYGKKPTKGILLSGPPGCGKTMIARVAASVVAKLFGKDVAFLNIKAAELQKPYVGQTEEIIRNLFTYAKTYKALHGHQLILFIDEADVILPRRTGGMRGVAGWEESNVATFLAEMDGMEESGAIVILATNRPEAIDQALLREGRIDRKIVVNRPNEESARIILERAFKGVPLGLEHVQGGNQYLCNLAMTELFSPLRHILKVKTERGTDFLNLGDCVSGAMVVGLVERAKANAFHRDIASGTMTGILEQDMMAAIEAVTLEQIANPDFYALTELAQRLKAPVLELDRVSQPELKYTGTLQ